MLILDDVGYVQQSPEEAEILLTFLAERFRASLRCSPADEAWAQLNRRPVAVVNTQDAEETFAYMIMLSANKLLGKWQKISFCGREHPGAFARQRKTRTKRARKRAT
jgi:hypothetical protein